jgi:hypothetical protein
MKGLELSRRYFETCGRPLISGRFSEYEGRITAGLAGGGSECFGYDDELSRDHDWGPGFCMWLTDDDFRTIGGDLQEAYRDLPGTFLGFGPRQTSPGEEHRVGVQPITLFYSRYTGLDHPPENVQEWLRIPEQNLAACTNGCVFTDQLGAFTRWRERLLAFYPEDVRLFKTAALCLSMGQSGQYNFERSVRRGEVFAARYAETKFCADAISLVFLLNRAYRPFYKWLHRAVNGLPLLGSRMHGLVHNLVETQDNEKKEEIIEETAGLLIDGLRSQKLSDSESDFIFDHARSVHSRIKDEKVRALLPLAG